MKYAILGLVKGLIVGAGIGLAFDAVDRGNHYLWTKLVLGAVSGALTGFVAGPPVWRVKGHAFFRALVGAGVGVAFLALAYWLEPTYFQTRWTSGYVAASSVLGAGWGAFVEWDESRKG